MIARAIWLGMALAAAWVGLMFGSDIAQYRMMSQALADVEACGTDCDAAWARLNVVRGKR